MDQKPEITDIFLWANKTDAIKKELDVELFLFNKNYTPYSIRLNDELNNQIKPIFLFDLINYVNLGAGTGLSVREYEMSESEENVLLYSDTAKVSLAGTLVNLIEHQRSEIVEFSEQEHEFKTIKGVVARFSHKGSPDEAIHVVKQIQQSQSLRGANAWEINGGKFGSFKADVGVKMPLDNQVLIVGNDIFAFNPGKFEKLFKYDYKKQVLADKKVAEIERHFKLSFPDGLDLQTMVRERPKSINKLQRIEIGGITQAQVIDYADEMQLEIMTDDAGAIIILDNKDLDTFVNLINEDYMTSEITGRRYEVRNKKPLDDPEGEPPRG